MVKKVASFVFTLIIFLVSYDLQAQFDQERFGKNRIQHKNIEWYAFSSNNFDVYYYDGGMNNARMAINYLEAEFDRLTQMIGYVAYTKPKIFIYNSPEELLQSNLNLNKDIYTINGQTFFSKLLGEVAFTGTKESFKKELVYVTSKIIIEEMLYGSSVADAFQANLINSFPYWFIEGAAMYMAHGWSREMDDYMRIHFANDKAPKIQKLKDKESALVGQSIWNYIVEKHGRRYMSSVLNLSRISRNAENSISNTLGVSYKAFNEQWQSYYVKINEPVKNNFKSLNQKNEIASTSSSFEGAINDMKFSPDGKHLAYVINNGGRYKVQVRELTTNRERTIYKGGSVSADQSANLTSPVIAWRDTLNLAIASFKRGTTTLRSRAIDGSAQDKIFLRNITQILSFNFNSSGKTMAISAMSGGKTDLYTLNVKGQGRRITNDLFDNINPVWLNDSTLVYSSNFTQLPDSVANLQAPDIKLLPSYFNLFKVELADSVITTKLSNNNYTNIRPVVLNSAFVLHLSDQSGIMNLMRMSVENGTSGQVSSFNRSISAFDYSSRINRIAFSVKEGNKSVLYIEPFQNLDQFTMSTPRVQMAQAKLMSERIATRRSEASEKPTQDMSKPVDVAIDNLLVTKPATTSVSTSTDSIPPRKNLTGSINMDRLKFENKGGIDTDNYSFDTLLVSGTSTQRLNAFSRNDILNNFRKQSLRKSVMGPRRMEPEFITNNLKNNWVIDPLRGFGVSLNGKMTDLLDNHSFQGGIMFPLDFRSGSDLFFEYELLKYRVDVRGRIDRRAIQLTNGELFQKYVLTKSEIGLSYPISVHSRFTIAPFVAKTQYLNLNPDSILRGQQADQNRLNINYAGGKFEFVIDKTRQMGLYMQQGIKGKIGVVHYQGLNASERSFSNAYLDFRNYQKIHKNITLATRIFAGSFFGNNPQTYLVGGMNNWLFNRFHQPPSNRPEASPVRNPQAVENSNILFAEFVDLRGYNYDEIRGRNVITFTSELRLPVFSYLSRGNITSNFIKNFQLVGFYDVGSSWNQAPPWQRVNDQNTEVISSPGSPFLITVNNFNNPWLQSYGAGLRTVLMNYYVKVDVARPVRNFQTADLKLYVTLGYNF
jgi:hypothetical protein